MTRNPFLVQGPASVSFSGGRTSAYMLRQILDAHGGTLPPDVIVLFANTGKERLETLDFVHECETRWSVPIRWVEYASEPDGDGLAHVTRSVTYETASREGEPFAALIRARSFLPNPIMRFCTSELKIRPMGKACRALGWDHWTNLIGLRADEPRRVAKTTAPTRQRWDNECPLARAGVTVADVAAYWTASPFDLQLMSHEGNCDLCFLKGRAKIERIMRARPDLATWWAEQEEDKTFRKDRPTYRRMLENVQASPMLTGLDIDDETMPCGCTD